MQTYHDSSSTMARQSAPPAPPRMGRDWHRPNTRRPRPHTRTRHSVRSRGLVGTSAHGKEPDPDVCQRPATTSQPGPVDPQLSPDRVNYRSEPQGRGSERRSPSIRRCRHAPSPGHSRSPVILLDFGHGRCDAYSQRPAVTFGFRRRMDHSDRGHLFVPILVLSFVVRRLQ